MLLIHHLSLTLVKSVFSFFSFFWLNVKMRMEGKVKVSARPRRPRLRAEDVHPPVQTAS